MLLQHKLIRFFVVGGGAASAKMRGGSEDILHLQLRDIKRKDLLFSFLVLLSLTLLENIRRLRED